MPQTISQQMASAFLQYIYTRGLMRLLAHRIQQACSYLELSLNITRGHKHQPQQF